MSTQATNLITFPGRYQTAYLGTHIYIQTFLYNKSRIMYVTMLIAVPHYPDMIMAFVLSQTKSDLHLKNLRGKKKESKIQQETVPNLPMFQ